MMNKPLPAMKDAEYSCVIKGTHPSMFTWDADVIRALNFAVTTVAHLRREDDPPETQKLVQTAINAMFALQMFSPIVDNHLDVDFWADAPEYSDGDVVADIFAGR